MKMYIITRVDVDVDILFTESGYRHKILLFG